mmetsp:Transcript_49240/g.148206  ORF Transcript_49240/g.148206 Transcript_49240/m.148206 type:complete len:387 (+) Transcript_49240:1348-2508(+)
MRVPPKRTPARTANESRALRPPTRRRRRKRRIIGSPKRRRPHRRSSIASIRDRGYFSTSPVKPPSTDPRRRSRRNPCPYALPAPRRRKNPDRRRPPRRLAESLEALVPVPATPRRRTASFPAKKKSRSPPTERWPASIPRNQRRMRLVPGRRRAAPRTSWSRPRNLWRRRRRRRSAGPPLPPRGGPGPRRFPPLPPPRRRQRRPDDAKTGERRTYHWSWRTSARGSFRKQRRWARGSGAGTTTTWTRTPVVSRKASPVPGPWRRRRPSILANGGTATATRPKSTERAQEREREVEQSARGASRPRQRGLAWRQRRRSRFLPSMMLTRDQRLHLGATEESRRRRMRMARPQSRRRGGAAASAMPCHSRPRAPLRRPRRASPVTHSTE